MLPIPAALQASFEAYLRAGEIPEAAHASYKKWLRFYLKKQGNR
jgi:acyl-CoA hydrolase